jgi:DNA-binding SARP family transcriptional activator/tetratricopeptide (TPR) repeat protein
MTVSPPPQLRLLGAVAAVHADGPATSPSAMVRTLLALLALHAGRPLSTSLVVEELWGDSLPKNPRNAVQVLVTRLRRWLPDAGIDADALRFEQDSYMLDVAPEAVDAVLFNRSAQRANDESLPANERLAAADDALARWQGEPFTGCARGALLESEARRLEEVWLATLELRHELMLRLGRHAEIVADISVLASQYPERERLARVAMLALYRSGRQHDALAVYQAVRNHLIDEYGLEASPELTELETRILEQDPTLDAEAALDVAPVASDLGAANELVGRATDRARVAELVASPATGIVVLVGEAGIGKSTLVRAALRDAVAAGSVAALGSWDGDPSPLAVWAAVVGAVGISLGDLRVSLRGEALASALRRRLAELARDQPVVLALDDVHLADSSSLALLVALAKLGLPERVTILAAAREPDLEPHAAWLAARVDLARVGGFETLALAELPRDDVTELVRARLDDAAVDPQGEIADVVWELTSGHPLHAVALLDVMRSEPDVARRRDAAQRVPDSLRPLVQFQLATLDRGCRDAVELLAISGRTTPAVLARRRGLATTELIQDLRPALDAGLVTVSDGRLGLRHALARAAVEDQIPAPARQVLHVTCLDDAQAGQADPFRVLRYARGAGALVEPARVASVQLEAGKVAYARGAFVEATELLRAARANLAGVAATEATLYLGLVASATGERALADDLFDEVIRDLSPDASVELLAAAALGHDPHAVTAMGNPSRLARLRIAAERTAGLRTQERFDLMHALLFEERVAEDVRGAVHALDELEELAAVLDSKVDLARVADMRTRDWFDNTTIDVRTRLTSAQNAYDIATTVDDPHVRLGALESFISASLAVGDLERAHDLRWELERVGERWHLARARWAAAIVEATLLLAAGDPGADNAATRARELGERLGVPDALGAFGVHTFTAQFLAGDAGGAIPVVELAVAMYPNVPAWRAGTALAYAAAGRVEEAREQLQQYLAARATSTTNLFDKPGLCLAAVAAFTLADASTAKALLEVLRSEPTEIVVVGLGAAVLGPVDFYVGLAELTLGDRNGAARLETAAARAEALGWAPWATTIRSLTASRQ